MTQRKKISEAPSGEKTTLAGTEKFPISGSQYALVSSVAAYIRTLTQTLTSKTINLTDNTLTGTKAQFNTAVNDGDIAFDAFKTISVSGQSDVVADSATDTLTFAAGSNVTITTNAGTDTVTIATTATGDVATDAIWDAKGDLAVGTGANTAARLAVGGNGLVLTANSGETTGLKWDSVAGTGDVVGPGSATDNAITRFDSTTGKLIQNSSATVDDSGTVNIPTGQTYNINGASVVDDTAYDATTWNGDTTHAPSKNAVRDKIETLSAGGRTLISEQTPTGTGTVTWSGISGSYKKLTLEFAVRSTQAAAMVNGKINFNTDTTATNYRYTEHFAYGTNTTGANGGDDCIFTSGISGANGPTGSFTIGKIEIIQYANTGFNKQAGYSGNHRRDTSSLHQITYRASVEWENTAAITQIDIVLSAGNFETGSVLRLYGET